MGKERLKFLAVRAIAAVAIIALIAGLLGILWLLQRDSTPTSTAIRTWSDQTSPQPNRPNSAPKLTLATISAPVVSIPKQAAISLAAVAHPHPPELKTTALADLSASSAAAGSEIGTSSLKSSDSVDSLAIAMQPSLKYKPNYAGPLAATSLSSPLLALKKQPHSARSNPSAFDSEREKLIESALEMEQDRKFTMSMCRDLRGCIWIGTEDGGVQRFDPSAPELQQWTQFTTKDGLGDNSGYAVACDRFGRIWVGHLNHGISVYNGIRWQNYEVVGGISRPDSLSGPLGERVFAIKVCPNDGDVWMASSCGLSRYSESHAAWTYYTRADGLPSDQAQTIAFDRSGNIYLGTQCDGIAIAHAADDYKRWQVVTGPERLPTEPTGSGLPTSLINDLLVAHDGAVYAATTAGLAWSKDQGITWQFVRGQDWADKVRGLYGGPPRSWKPQAGGWLAEDYITSLAEGSDGLVWIGYRQHGWQLIDVHNGRVVKDARTTNYITCLIATGLRSVVVSTYGDAPPQLNSEEKLFLTASKLCTAELPQGAKPPSVDELDSMTSRLSSVAAPSDVAAAYLGEDWTTQGDWVGRYGRQHNNLCGAMSPFDQQLVWDNIHQIHGQMGPNHKAGDSLRAYISWIKTDDHRTLYDPIEGVRRQSEWDDHGEVYPESQDGPDEWISITVPVGIQRISLYFINNDGHGLRERIRDYRIEIFDHSVDQENSYAIKPLAGCRVRNFWGGVYKQFLVNGPASYRIRVARNGSLNTILSGVFIDRVFGASTPVDTMPMPWFGDVKYDEPDIDEVPQAGAGYSALKLWLVLDGTYTKSNSWAEQFASRRIAFRTAALSGAPLTLLNNWRWNEGLWTTEDRRHFARKMDLGWSAAIKLCSTMVWENRTPLSQ